MMFLKPEQVNTSFIEEEIQCDSFNIAVVETMNVNEDLAEAFKAALSTDPQVGPRFAIPNCHGTKTISHSRSTFPSTQAAYYWPDLHT